MKAPTAGQCAEFCGIFHEAMHATVIATSDAEYAAWVAGAAKNDLGREEFQGVCATCHGMKGQGGYGPAIADNSIIVQPAGLDAIVRNGRGNMPAVGATWTAAQMHALLVYLKTHVYTGDGDEWRLERNLSTRVSWKQRPDRELGHDRRPQADRDPLHHDVARVLRGRRRARAAHALAARDAERAFPDEERLQQHDDDARHDDDLPRRRPDPRRASGTTSCR